ncbi:hypothetical protein FB45DRAFT_942113 [Roridomyces roridus]|uniref:Uncharacterized protein n=1 Tax=Roridomyces roridus TaxID=1738132 RepID=A0AAD7B687_9AGAR|nr:hypothetical protein FB45DRAFT_942113 [Roridomyces roridus]
MLLDTLDSLSSVYDSLVDAVLQGLAFLAKYLLFRRAPLRPPGSWSRLPPGETHKPVEDWKDVMGNIGTHFNALQERWPLVIEGLQAQLNDLPKSSLLSWLSWMDPTNVAAHVRKLATDLSILKEAAPCNITELMNACAGLDIAFARTRESASANHLQTIETALDELIALNMAFMRYRAGYWISNRMTFEQCRMKDLNTSPLNSLFLDEVDYLREHRSIYVQYIKPLNCYSH